MVAAINGFNTSATREATMALNAAPRITATARSTTFPRKMKSRNPFSMGSSGEFQAQPARDARTKRWPLPELPIEHFAMLHGDAPHVQQGRVPGELSWHSKHDHDCRKDHEVGIQEDEHAGVVEAPLAPQAAGGLRHAPRGNEQSENLPVRAVNVLNV